MSCAVSQLAYMHLQQAYWKGRAWLDASTKNCRLPADVVVLIKSIGDELSMFERPENIAPRMIHAQKTNLPANPL
jgi:hypothetical protein